MKKYKWLLFDADGTLFDYNKAEYGALKKTFARFDIEFNQENIAKYKEANSSVWREFEKGNISPDNLKIKRFEILSLKLNLSFDFTEMSKKYLENLSGFTDLIDGASEVIEKLSKRYKLAIVTNGLTCVQEKRFAESSIGKYFEDYFISEKMGIAKPSGKYFDIVFNAIGNPAKPEVLIIGDNLNSDILGGVNYGVDTCWFNPDKSENARNLKINYEITNLKELLGILNN